MKTMPNENETALEQIDFDIKSKIHTNRGVQVMMDSDLAKIYGYETKYFNRQVKRNSERFPNDFMFQISKKELDE